MHRIVSARSIYQNNFHNIVLPSRHSFTNHSLLDIKCSFCQKILSERQNSDIIFHTRHQSTRTASALKSQKKKTKHKSYKKYGELLEVGEKAMTETKVSISRLGAVHLSKLASSSVSLGQLHQLTNKSTRNKKINEVDSELLESVKEKILKKAPSQQNNSIGLQDDNCALVYSNAVLDVNDWYKTKQCMDLVKESYYNFQKATLYDQRLQDLRYAINEGINQEFNFSPPSTTQSQSNDVPPVLRSPHAVFKELFVDNQMDSYDMELMTHMSHLQTSGIAHPVLEDLIDDPSLHNELAEEDHDFDLIDEQKLENIKSLKIVKAKALKEKKKAIRNKKKAKQEISMKEKIQDIDLRGKRDSLHRLLLAHMQLLCTLNMVHEARKIVQYYRHRASKVPCFANLTDVNIYNTLLHGYASMGNLEETRDLLNFMKQDNVEPNPQTFAAIFECIEHSNIKQKENVLKEYVEVMKEKGITCNDILDNSKFLNRQRESVLDAIHRIDPSFQPKYTPPELDHNCDLLEKLTLDKTENRKGLNKSPATGIMSVEELKQKAKLQFETEIRGDIVIENIAVKDAESDTMKLYRQKLEETETEWRGIIKEAFIRNVGTLKSQSNASHTAITLYPYLKVLSVDQFVELLMGELSKLVDGSETYSPTLKLLQRELGTMVYHKYQIEQYRKNGVLDKMSRVYDQYCDWYMNRKIDGVDVNYNCRQAWQVILMKNMQGPSLDIEEAPWPIEMRQNIGKFLYNIIINDVKIDINMFKTKAKVKKLPAVYKVHRPWGRVVRLELKPHPALARLWALAARAQLTMRAALCAVAAPPRPWAGSHAGAYLLTDVPLIRMPMFVMNQWKRLQEVPPSQLYPVLDSLNQLGEVPWTINQDILDLQMQVFRNGGNKKLDIPPPSSSLDTSKFGDKTDAAAAFKRRIAINRARAEMHSLWCDSLYKLSLANHYRDSVFWLPHNMDFRGRVYACPPHISQLGADASRALLKFAKREPLGPHGLRWLKLHAVNLTGTMKKFTVEERLQYADSILDKILDSADQPLDGDGWWKQSEEPWQTLACCMEIARAVRSPNPEEYLTGFPVHQDGSCNGLQHYAALGGDASGARAVNLPSTPRPQDVYTAVAALVEEMRKRDALAGNPQAIVLENFVRRKVIKQTVMTTVYGVTRFGARLQIAKQLKDIDEFPKDQVWACSQYLTTKTFDSLREMFASTKLIQDWFTDCAKLISSVCGESVEWTSALGLPIVQPYYRRAAPTHAQAHKARHATRPCTMKQRNAFPPNFIHSLDSCHMMLTGLHCQAAGVTFVSVHDCFWTHPNTAEVMNKICREQFVALHSQPILEDLSEFMVKRYSYDESELVDKNVGAANKKRVNDLLRRVPSKGDFDITSVLDSVYFFS